MTASCDDYDRRNDDTGTGRDDGSPAELEMIWGELGYDSAARAASVQALVDSARTQLTAMRNKHDDLTKALHILYEVMGSDPAKDLTDEGLQGKPLLQRIDKLSNIYADIAKEASAKLSRFVACKQTLTTTASDMWLENDDLPSILHGILTLEIDTDSVIPDDFTASPDNVSVLENPLTVRANVVLSAKLTLNEEFVVKVESAIKKLNVSRAQTTSKLVAVRAAAAGLCEALQLTEKMDVLPILEQCQNSLVWMTIYDHLYVV
jgi:hypothetical protein